MQLVSGQNVILPAPQVTASLLLGRMPVDAAVDVVVFVLGADGRSTGSPGYLSHGISRSADGAFELNAASRTLVAQLDSASPAIERVALCVYLRDAARNEQSLQCIQSLQLNVKSGSETFHFTPDLVGIQESSLIVGELYRRNGQWRARAVGQGFKGGSQPLAQHFGLSDFEEPRPAVAAPPAPAAPPVPLPAPSASAPAASATVNLSKIVLEKSRPISLEKADNRFGRIVVNLRWSKGGGFLSRSVDLDLGAMVELQDGGTAVVQALGRSFGDTRQPPYVQLLGDDRSGASGDGEFMHINGDHWPQIKRILIFAFIYAGAPNWAKAAASVSVTMPGQPQLEARLDSPNDRDGMCAIAMLDNVGGQLRATKLVDYFSGHDTMDARHGFGFSWRPGSK